MRSEAIFIDATLHSLRLFLDRMWESVGKDYTEIKEREEAGELEEEDAFLNAMYEPMQSEEIAIRACYSELNALIISECQILAIDPLGKQNKETKGRRRIVLDLSLKELSELIESYYNLKLKNLSGYDDIRMVNEIANSRKHHLGFKDPRKSEVIPEKHDLSRETLNRSLDATQTFLSELLKAAQGSPKH